MNASQALRDEYRAQKTALMQSIASSGPSTRGVRAGLQKISRLTAATLRTRWLQSGFAEPVALVAVGGFGREELFPHSDVDVLLLLPDDQSPDNDAQLKGQIEAFIGNCWDAGLEIGSSVRTVSECLAQAAKDVTVQTSLLESRLITGAAQLFQGFMAQFTANMDAKAFFVAKTLEMRQRHNKFENTPYSLEPNCKESPGGLRDLQIILWVAKAAGFGKNWDELARNGLATAFEVKQIKRNEALLRLIRARLHLIAQRREDRLVFDLQTSVATSFGYVAPTFGTGVSSLPPVGAVLPRGGPSAKRSSSSGQSAVRPSEALMRRSYWAAKAVTQLNQILLMNIEERLNPSVHESRPINERFFDKAGMIEVAMTICTSATRMRFWKPFCSTRPRWA